MKKIILLFTLIVLTYSSNAQGTLQFNRALLLTNNQTEVVPSGKVWKIVSATLADRLNFGDSNWFYFKMNGAEHHVIWSARTQSYGERMSGLNCFPVWVPAGTSVNLPAVGTDDTTTRLRSLSIIEFNIVP
jgi:hypothetical protein